MKHIRYKTDRVAKQFRSHRRASNETNVKDSERSFRTRRVLWRRVEIKFVN